MSGKNRGCPEIGWMSGSVNHGCPEIYRRNLLSTGVQSADFLGGSRNKMLQATTVCYRFNKTDPVRGWLGSPRLASTDLIVILLLVFVGLQLSRPT